MILWVLAWATGNRELPFTLMGNTAGGIRLWRKNQQFDIEHIQMKVCVRHPNGEIEWTVGLSGQLAV